MSTPASRLRGLLREPGLIIYPGVFDAPSARVALDEGFQLLGLGGNSLGTKLCMPEPLLTLDELCTYTRYIVDATDAMLKVDAGAGFGDPIHVARTVRDLEQAGAAAIHIEDQLFPKRAHYHLGLAHVIPEAEMVDKIKAAVDARLDENTVIIARTDAVKDLGFEAGIERMNKCLEAGADVAFIYTQNDEQSLLAPKQIEGPVIYSVSDGNRKGRPLYTAQQIEEMGYKIASFPSVAIMNSMMALDAALEQLTAFMEA